MTTTLKFYIKTGKSRCKGRCYSIYLRIIHNRKKSEGKISTTKISAEELKYWVEDSERFSTKQKHLLEHNILLNEIQNKFHDYLRIHITKMAEVTPSMIVDYLLSRNIVEQITVIKAINEYYNQVVLTDKDKAEGTKRNYKKSKNHLSNFLKRKKLMSLLVTDFKRSHVSKFIDFLKTPIPKENKVGLNGQSVHSVVKNIKPIFKKLLFEEQIATNPFEGVKIPFEKAVKPRLSNENFIDIVRLDLSDNKTLEIYRDIFVFLCYTGLSYCDTIDLRQSDVKLGFIALRRKKSKVQTRQFLTKQTIKLLERYKNEVPEQRILPQRSLDKLNINLKIIAAMANIDFPLCTYTARRFFRQSIFESGIRESLVIKSLMGHTNSSDIDSHYFLVTDAILKVAKKRLQKHFKKLLK